MVKEVSVQASPTSRMLKVCALLPTINHSTLGQGRKIHWNLDQVDIVLGLGIERSIFRIYD